MKKKSFQIPPTFYSPQVCERVSLVVGEVESVGGRMPSQEEEGLREDKEMVELVGRSLEVYAAMRRERPASRADTSPRQIAQLTVRMLKRREALKQAAYNKLVRKRYHFLIHEYLFVPRLS